MRFRSYDGLRVFDVVARHLSFTTAADELNLTKGAVSYQIGRLEDELGFPVFIRRHRTIALTERGAALWQGCHAAFRDLERQIADLRDESHGRITIGMATYFASRWLSPRLMTFMVEHPRIGLRLQPLVDLIELRPHGIDMAIRWGKGDWDDMEIERLFRCPAFPVAGPSIARRADKTGLETVLSDTPLLHDRDGSAAWRDWHQAAGLPYRPARDALVIPDPNVRVQAVIDGQGIALYDTLVSDEMEAGRLARVSAIEMEDYGYFLAFQRGAFDAPGLAEFRDWIQAEASQASAAGRRELSSGD